MTVVRVLLVHDQAPFLRAMSAVGEETPGFVSEASCGEDSILASAELLSALVLEGAAGGRDVTLVGSLGHVRRVAPRYELVGEIISSITTCGDPCSSHSLLASGHEGTSESEIRCPGSRASSSLSALGPT